MVENANIWPGLSVNAFVNARSSSVVDVLLIDADEQRSLFVQRAIQLTVGVRCARKSSGREALASYQRARFDELVDVLCRLTASDVADYKVEGGNVTLFGQVTRPTLKSDAERAVKGIEGVERVDNRIEVLPLSPNDDRIRRAVYRAIYGTEGLDRYGLRAVPTIHIIVKNGHVFLEGAVANEGDKNLANIKANGVSGVFSVTNNLRVAEKS